MLVIINWLDATQRAFLTPETELYVILFTQEKTTELFSKLTKINQYKPSSPYNFIVII